MSWPPLYHLHPSQSLPAIARIGSRGDCSSRNSDISALEIYSFYSVNVDPVKTIDTLGKVVNKMNYNK